MEFETRAIHVGQEPDPATGAVTTPIYQTSTYVQDAVGVHKGYDYARVANPTRTALQECLASLEGAAHGHAFSSGLGAATTLMHLLSPRRPRRLRQRRVRRHLPDVLAGVRAEGIPLHVPLRAGDLERARPSTSTSRTRLVWLESPTNPLLNLVDIRAAAEAAHAVGALVVVDNTFATPVSAAAALARRRRRPALDDEVPRRPLRRGRRVPGRRTTTRSPSVSRSCRSRSAPCPGPFDCWLVLRGVKTLAVRMEKHCENAGAIAAFLERETRVEHVFYPGLPTHPGHRLAAAQMRNFGGMVSFLAASEEEAVALVARTKIWKLAESLGGVESLIEQPARMTHASTADAPFAVPPSLVRLSVGIEAAHDLIDDLDAALAG